MPEFNLPDLKAWRKALGLTQKQLADKAEINLLTLRKIEDGGFGIRQSTFNKITQAMKNAEDAGKAAPTEQKESALESAPRPSMAEAKASTPPPVHIEAKPVVPKTPVLPSQVTHLDLELIRRVLPLTAREKIKLLETMM